MPTRRHYVIARFMAAHHPEQLGSLQRIIGLPFKRGAQDAPIEYVDRAEVEALLGLPFRRRAETGSQHIRAVHIPRKMWRSPFFAERGLL